MDVRIDSHFFKHWPVGNPLKPFAGPWKIYRWRVQSWQPNEGYNKPRDTFVKPDAMMQQNSQGNFQNMMGSQFQDTPNKFNMLEEQKVQYNSNLDNNENKSNILSHDRMKEKKNFALSIANEESFQKIEL